MDRHRLRQLTCALRLGHVTRFVAFNKLDEPWLILSPAEKRAILCFVTSPMREGLSAVLSNDGQPDCRWFAGPRTTWPALAAGADMVMEWDLSEALIRAALTAPVQGPSFACNGVTFSTSCEIVATSGNLVTRLSLDSMGISNPRSAAPLGLRITVEGNGFRSARTFSHITHRHALCIRVRTPSGCRVRWIVHELE